jgi:hypothetical protein
MGRDWCPTPLGAMTRDNPAINSSAIAVPATLRVVSTGDILLKFLKQPIEIQRNFLLQLLSLSYGEVSVA